MPRGAFPLSPDPWPLRQPFPILQQGPTHGHDIDRVPSTSGDLLRAPDPVRVRRHRRSHPRPATASPPPSIAKPDPVPGRPACFVFIALHDNEANGFTPRTLVDIKITADAAEPVVTVHDTFPGRYPAHIAKQETIERFKRRLARHDFLFPMQVRR